MDMSFKRSGLPSREAMEEDDGVVELSLGLSIGRSSRKARGSGSAPQKRELDTGSGEAEADHGGSGASMPSSSPPPPLPPVQLGGPSDGLDPQRRREMHALRRQEARKKRHEKQQKKGSACGGRDGAAPAGSAVPGLYGSSPPPEEACSLDDQVALEAQERRWRVRDREAREEEARHSDRRASENHELGSDFVPNPELCPTANAKPNAGANPNPSISPNFSNPNLPPFGANPFPVMAMQYPYPHVQCVAMANGFGFPYMMPFWAPAMSSVAGGLNPATNVFQPVACRTFQPISPLAAEQTNGASPLGCKVVDSSGGNGTGIKRAPSWTGSLGSNSSSAISDHQSNSLHGGSSSSDIRSHSSRVAAESSHPQLSSQVSNLVQGQSEYSISSHQIEPEADAVEAPSQKRPSSNSTQSDTKGDPNPTRCPPAKLEGMVSVNKPVPAADEAIPSPLSSPLPRMPCVSTTGNGPNGKTITGFLYRYTSTEVSIVCVCHGSSFSPAEFVKHAGGTDIANPLRHIIVVPS